MKASPWVKWFSADFLNGISDLEPNEIAVYSVVLNLIYDSEGPIVDDAVKIGRRCYMRQTSAEKALSSLAAAGKLIRVGGKITNARCEKEIKSRQKVSEKSSEIANTRWKKEAEKPSKINAAPMPAHAPSIATEMLSLSLKPETEKKEGATPPKVAPEKQIILDAVEAFNQTAGLVGWAKVQLMNESRETSLRKRLSEAGGLAGWVAALEKAAKSRLLTGQKTDWKADFDFLLQRKSFTKLMEGGYDDNSIQGKSNGTDYPRSAADQILAAGRRKLDRQRSDGRSSARGDESFDIFTPTNVRNVGTPSSDYGGQAPRGRDEDTNVLAVSFSPAGRLG